nr:zinc finger, CCHC-type [Tanacetum cinerariifolium]
SISSITAQQAKLDLKLVPNEKRLEISTCNRRINPGKTHREPTFQVVMDALALTPCYSAFVTTADVLEVYMHQFWDSIYKHDTSYRFGMDKKNKLYLNLETFRDIFQICPRVLGQDFNEPPTDEEIMYFSKNQVILGKSNQSPIDTLVMSLSKKKESVTVKERKGIELPYEVALTEEAQYEEVRKNSLRDFYKTHPSGSGIVTKIALSAAKIKACVTNEGTSDKPGVPNVTEEESTEKSDSGDDNTQSDIEKWLDSEHETDENEMGSESDQEENKEEIDQVFDLDNILFYTYVKVYLLKRNRNDKDEDPSVGSDWGLKKRKTSKDAKPTKGSKTKESKSGSSTGTNSQSKSSGKSAHVEEPEFEKLDWDNPKGGDNPFDLTKPIPLAVNRNRQIVSVDYFFNNDLKYLQGGISTMTYTNFITMTKAAQYDLLGIRDKGGLYLMVAFSDTRCARSCTHALLVKDADEVHERFSSWSNSSEDVSSVGYLISESIQLMTSLICVLFNNNDGVMVVQIRKMSKWENDDYVYRGLILDSMSDTLFDIYQFHDSTKELWDYLETKYTAEDASSKNFLAHKSDKPKSNNVVGISVVNMVEHNNSTRIIFIQVLLEGHGGGSCSLWHKDQIYMSTPMDTSDKLRPNNGQSVSQNEYSMVTGYLMYVMTCTRPDIAFALGKHS